MHNTIQNIRPLPPERIAAAQAHLDQLTKPRGSLGYLETLAARYVAIAGGGRPSCDGRRVCVFAGDHKVVEEGVSAYPAEVTGLMVRNFLGGGAAINVLARWAGAQVEVVDVGMATDLGELPGLLRRNVKRGADNIARGPAMTPAECEAAIGVGIQCADRAARDGIRMLATGEMGIGNSTPATALLSAYLHIPHATLTGPGTGLDARGLATKVAVLNTVLKINANRLGDPLSTLAAVGGLEIAAICGLCLGGAAHSLAVVVDGFISSAGALAAMRICPAVKDYLFFAHQSAEPGHARLFESEGLRPIVNLGLRLGEGTGAALAMQLIAAAVAVHNEMATFADVGITPGA